MLLLALALLQPPALDVRKFGARPNDSLDDAGAVQKALREAARGPRRVYIPPGVFLVSETLRIPSGVTLFGSGRGSVLKLADGANCDLLQNADPKRGDRGIVVHDLRLDGNKEHQGRPPPGVVGFFVIRFLRASECVLERLWVEDAAGDGVSCWGGTGNVYRDIVVEGSRRYGIQIQGAKGYGKTCDIVVERCIARRCGWDGIDLGHAERVVVSNCVACENAHGGIVGDRSHFIKVIGCTCYRNGFFGIAAVDPAHRNPPRGWAILGNICFENKGGGIGLLNGARDAVVSGNQVYRNGGHGIWVGLKCRGIVIRGNACWENGRWGICVWGARDIVVEGNVCRDNGRTRVDKEIGGRPGGIGIFGTPQFAAGPATVVGNLCFNSDEGRTQRVGIAAGRVEGLVVEANLCYGHPEGDLALPQSVKRGELR